MKQLFFLLAMVITTEFVIAQNVVDGSTTVLSTSGRVSCEYVQLWENGPKWATFNVGSTITDYANLQIGLEETPFSGDTDQASYYNTANVGGIYADANPCINGRITTWDENVETGIADIATTLWGSNWQTPSARELDNLLFNCTWTWCDGVTTQYVPGCTLKGRKISGVGAYADRSIFLPITGFYNYNDGTIGLPYAGGSYWTSTIASDGESYSIGFDDVPDRMYMWSTNGKRGLPVRAIYVGPDPLTEYTRSVTPGNYGTICLSKAVAHEDIQGGVFFNIVYAVTNTNGEVTGILMEEEIGDLVAGKPYIFRATADELVLPYMGEAVAEPVIAKGLVGNLSETPLDVPQGMYVLSNNQIRKLNGGTATAGQNRAYIDLTTVTKLNYVPSAAPNRVMLNAEGCSETTDLENLQSKDVQKIVRDGQLLIIRDGKIYNVLGINL